MAKGKGQISNGFPFALCHLNFEFLFRATSSRRSGILKINPRRSFPRKRESTFAWADVHPRLRGGDDGPLRMTDYLTGLFCFLSVRLLDVPVGLVQGALRVVVGLQGALVLIKCPVALSCHVENLSQLHVTPHLDPLRVHIPIQGAPKLLHRRGVVPQLEEDVTYFVVSERAVLVKVKDRLILFDSLKVSLLLAELVAARHFDLELD